MSSTSIRQLAANRANSTTHGLSSCSAQLVVFHWESQQDFDDLRNAYLIRHQPLDRCELDQVDQMVACIWRRQRILSIETTLLNLELSRNDEDTTARFGGTADSLLRMALAFQEKQGDKTFDTIQRYASNLDRSFSRARNELQILQRDRFNQPPPPPPAEQPPVPASTPDDPESEADAPSTSSKIQLITERSHFANPSEPVVDSEPQAAHSGESDEPSKASRDSR